jgi:hypothetical protein
MQVVTTIVARAAAIGQVLIDVGRWPLWTRHLPGVTSIAGHYPESLG